MASSSSSSSDSEDYDERLLPSAEECTVLIAKFVETTNTNSALAQYFLQKVQWNLTRAMNKYFAAEDDDFRDNAKVIERPSQHSPEQDVVVENIPAEYKGLTVTTVPPRTCLFVTWNLDGLDPTNLKARTKHVCEMIREQKMDVVFLQEVIPETYAILKEMLPEYHMCTSGSFGYFNVTLLRIFTVYFDSREIVPFNRTSMGRNLLIVMAHIGTVDLVLINTHLESTAKHASARIAQLQEAFDTLNSCDKNKQIILAGDFNLRDQELKLGGGMPNGIGDAWLICGARKDAEFTWDLRHNTNHSMPCRFQPHLRFDRIYIRPSVKVPLTPTQFGLIGLEKVPNTQSFPSDHWGIRVLFFFELPPQ